ncbi:pyrroline-5-carboxylate reductase [Nitzschia inconspicua]|uniref:Pyrroline-5-carboxylate reductase n=1 Tax=Nitzschia inconspicua TaxID=303405 RepID=A0A9K3PN89_9STRA|nr:pyrroline-5-carboxylate reductase [Nitzschia inconspicua]
MASGRLPAIPVEASPLTEKREVSMGNEHHTSLSVGFVGCGMMASALMDGIVREKVVKDQASIVCSDIFQPSLDIAKNKGYHVTTSNEEVCNKAKDVVLIAVKPNVVEDVCLEIRKVKSNALIISIAAGVQIKALEKHLPGRRVVRVMPNTGCLIAESASGYAMGELCTSEDKEIVEAIFGAVGTAQEIKEILLNAVTGLSGSGPAYVYQFIEALADGGVRSGLPRDVAMQLAAQTVKGAAEMVLQTGEHPGSLKDKVCSPGGTTIAGVQALENGGFRAATIAAVTAATRRSMQLGDIPEQDIRHLYNL